MPEPYGSDRNLIPEETFVLLGSFHDENHLKWILGNKLYNTRTDTGNGSVRLKQEISSARYLLLHKDEKQIMLRLGDKGPRVMSKERLSAIDANSSYKPSLPYYVVFDISSNNPDKEFKDVRWDIGKMIKDGIIKGGHQSAAPEGVSLATLMKYVIHNQK